MKEESSEREEGKEKRKREKVKEKETKSRRGGRTDPETPNEADAVCPCAPGTVYYSTHFSTDEATHKLTPDLNPH